MSATTRVPPWTWGFVLACGLTVALTGSPLSTIQGMAGVIGAAICFFVARDASKSTSLRVMICLGVLVVSWLIFAAMKVSLWAMS